MMKKSFYGLVVCLSMFAVVLCSGVASAAPGDACNINIDCDDELFCTGIESCSTETSTCVAGPGDPCAEGQTCNEETDTCDAAGGCTEDADCDDLLFCNGAETCVAEECVAGTDPCTGDTPECIEEGTGTCVECLNDEDCAGELICENNECIDDACPPDTPPEVLLYDTDGNCLLSKEELKTYSAALKTSQKQAKDDLKATQTAEKNQYKMIKSDYAE